MIDKREAAELNGTLDGVVRAPTVQISTWVNSWIGNDVYLLGVDRERKAAKGRGGRGRGSSRERPFGCWSENLL